MTQHAETVLQAVTSGRAAARSPLAASWVRSFAKHKLDPAETRAVREPDVDRLRHREEVLGRLLHVAQPRLDDLYRMVGHCGRGIFLTDDQGLVLRARTTDSDDALFGGCGLTEGTDWSEAAQGTNGIGTCLTEERALTIHRDEHYLARNIQMSCIDAPVFDPDGNLIAALDVSSARRDQADGFNQLIGAMVIKVAAQIETDLFRENFPAHRIVLTGDDRSGSALLAVDRDDIVVGATRDARLQFELERRGRIRPVPLRDLTGEDSRGLEGAERAALMRADGNVSAAARDLGIGRATLYRRMKRLGISENDANLSHS